MYEQKSVRVPVIIEDIVRKHQEATGHTKQNYATQLEDIIEYCEKALAKTLAKRRS